MTIAWLVFITAEVLQGQAPPKVLQPFTSVEACEVARAKARVAVADDLRAMPAALVCLKIASASDV